jgi:hypothetical protein
MNKTETAEGTTHTQNRRQWPHTVTTPMHCLTWLSFCLSDRTSREQRWRKWGEELLWLNTSVWPCVCVCVCVCVCQYSFSFSPLQATKAPADGEKGKMDSSPLLLDLLLSSINWPLFSSSSSLQLAPVLLSSPIGPCSPPHKTTINCLHELAQWF